jgi:MGT family glycosyltransferase
MARQHIAVFTPLVGGHVFPALGLCSELVSRGHRVSFATNEDFAPRVRAVGATPKIFQVPEFKFPGNIVHDSWSGDAEFWRTFAYVSCPMLLGTAAAVVEELREYYATDPPDLILYDWFAFAGRILAKQLGCPAAQVHGHFAHRNSLMRIDGVGETPEPMRAFGKLVDAFMSTYGFQENDHLWYFEKLNIFFVPRAFQYDADSFDGRFKFVGATHNRKPKAGVWKNRNEGRKPLLLISEATSSTNGAFLKQCVAAFAESKYHVVVSKAPATPELDPASAPSNFEINREAFNCEILPFANVMLCEGGMGSTLEPLYHGVPVVAVPPNPFNAEVSYRLAELGLGLHVRLRTMTPGTLRAAVDTASSDEALIARVKRMQSDLVSSPAAEAAADAIEEYLA